MTTLATMRTKIASDIVRSDLTSDITTAINRAITFYESKRFWFQETTGTFSTAANTQSYASGTIPSDIKEIDDVHITINSNYQYDLKPVVYSLLIKKNVGNFTDQPLEYAWFASKLWLYPTPSDIWTITLSYQKSYATLSADSDTSDWTVYAEDLIEARTKWILQEDLLKDYDAADRAKKREQEALSILIEKTNKLKATNMIAATNF